MTDATIEKSTLPFNAHAMQLLAIAALAAAADWLFYERAIGISALIFLSIVFAVSVFANRKAEDISQALQAATLFVAGVLPLVYSINTLSFLFAIAGTVFAAQMAAHPRTGWAQRIVDSFFLLTDIAWRAIADLLQMWQQRSAVNGSVRRNSMVAWVVPLVLGATFISLFASANPVIDDWLAAIDWQAWLNAISFPRVGFWLVAIVAVWPLVFLKNRSQTAAEMPARQETDAPKLSDTALFGKTAILRSLVMFNVLFAVQSALDAAYLWGGLELPHGMSYANYAHRGAYPLIVTALLAAGFVLVATRRGSEAESSPLIRKLVYLWTAQNIVLVISSGLRLSLYVAVYSLTYWRVAAFIWMVLVAIGLVLIIARLLLNRPSSWLVAANVLSLVFVLYTSCFVNFPLLIANYNVTHSRDLSGKGVELDLHYIISLGPHAVPAIDRYILFRQYSNDGWTFMRATELAQDHLNRMQDWRAWSYSDWQLVNYLHGRRAAIHSDDNSNQN